MACEEILKIVQSVQSVQAVWLIGGLGTFFKENLFGLQILIYFFHVLLDSNLFEINISYGFGDIQVIKFLCQ